MKVNGKDDIPYMKWKIKKCLKPPTREDHQHMFDDWRVRFKVLDGSHFSTHPD